MTGPNTMPMTNGARGQSATLEAVRECSQSDEDDQVFPIAATDVTANEHEQEHERHEEAGPHGRR